MSETKLISLRSSLIVKICVGLENINRLLVIVKTYAAPTSMPPKLKVPLMPERVERVSPDGNVIVIIALRMPRPPESVTRPPALTVAAVGEKSSGVQKPVYNENCPPVEVFPATVCPAVAEVFVCPFCIVCPPPAMTVFVIVKFPPDNTISFVGVSCPRAEATSRNSKMTIIK